MDPSWAIPQSLVRIAILVEEVVLGAKLLGRGAKLPAVRFSKKNPRLADPLDNPLTKICTNDNYRMHGTNIYIYIIYIQINIYIYI